MGGNNQQFGTCLQDALLFGGFHGDLEHNWKIIAPLKHQQNYLVFKECQNHPNKYKSNKVLKKMENDCLLIFFK